MRATFLLKSLIAGILFAVLMTGCYTAPPSDTTTTPTIDVTVPTITETVPPTTSPVPLVMVLPLESHTVTLEEGLLFSGICDPAKAPTLNGQPVPCSEDGTFSYMFPLELGQNAITLTYQDETLTYTAERRYTTEFFAYESGATVNSGASVYANIFARNNSTVSATFYGQSKNLTLSTDQLGCGASEGFQLYTARFDTPSKNEAQEDLGVITYTVTCDGVTEVYNSGTILCLPAVEVKKNDPEATPTGGSYVNVGSGYIVEVVDVNAETFNGNSLEDKSRPTNNYLPKGTVDYGYPAVYTNTSAQRNYYKLRCGIRVYQRNNNTPYGMTPVVDCYTGTLPDHNEIGVASFVTEGHHSYLTLDCLWKAPFFFDEEAQDYDPRFFSRKYDLLGYDAGFIDITFCYATQVTGFPEIPADHPLFSGAEWIANESDHTLRLYLKEKGNFYGWDAYYNEAGQLCFRFLNPVTVSAGDNAFGADLTGVRVMIDVGHGGMDPGAAYCDSQGKYWEEAERNLVLGHLIRENLESIGATVIMNRSVPEETLSRTERLQFLAQEAPDFCVCVHHNAHVTGALTGFESCYFTGFSYDAARHIWEATQEEKVYWGNYLTWHHYFVARQTPCPIVLTENGFMSSKREMDDIANQAIMERKAKAIVQGIANFYLEENGLLPSG